MKRILCGCVMTAMLALYAAPACAASAADTLATRGTQYIVTADSLNVRYSPSRYAPVKTYVHRSRKVTFLSQKNGWWYVRLPNGKTGYVDKKYLAPTSQPKAAVYTVRATRLNLRAKPNTDAKILIRVPEGKRLRVTRVRGDWGAVSYGGKQGWVALRYLAK